MKGEFFDKEQELEEEVAKFKGRNLYFTKEDNKEILKELIADNHSDEKKEFMREAQDIVVKNAVKGYRREIAAKCLKRGMNVKDICEIFDMPQSEVEILKKSL